MDDITDSREREAVLPDHRGNIVTCANVNVTSVDSGVETGNDSNDSSTIQQEGLQSQQQVVPSQAIGSPFAEENVGIFPNLDMFFPALIHPFFPDETKRCSSARLQISPYKKFKLQNGFQLERMQYHSHRLNQLLNFRNFCHSKIKERVFRPSHKHTTPFTLSSWHIERIYRRMRFAATTNNILLIKGLLECGVSPNNNDDHGRTPLHISACRGYTEIVKLLLDNGADPNLRDCIGNTPLHLATVNSKLSVVTLLLTAGTDVLALDSYGYNPLQLAKTKLRMLQRNCNNEDMLRVKEEMHNVINMLMAYLQKQTNMRDQVETLSNFCSRLCLSNTSDQIQDDVKDLLANINALSITD